MRKAKTAWRKNMTRTKKCINCLQSEEQQENEFESNIIKIRSLLFSQHKTLTSRRLYCCSRRCQDAVIKNGIDATRLRPFKKPLRVEWRIHSWLIRNCRDTNLYNLPSLKHLFKKKKLREQLIEPRVLDRDAVQKKKRITRLCPQIMTDNQFKAWCGHNKQHIEILANCGPYRISMMAVVIFLTQFYRKVGFYCIAALYGYSRPTSQRVYDAVREWLMKYYVPSQLISGDFAANKRVWTRDIIKNATPQYYYALHNKPISVVPLEPRVIETEEDEKEATRVYFEWVRKNWIAERELKAREENRREADCRIKGIPYSQLPISSPPPHSPHYPAQPQLHPLGHMLPPANLPPNSNPPPSIGRSMFEPPPAVLPHQTQPPRPPPDLIPPSSNRRSNSKEEEDSSVNMQNADSEDEQKQLIMAEAENETETRTGPEAEIVEEPQERRNDLNLVSTDAAPIRSAATAASAASAARAAAPSSPSAASAGTAAAPSAASAANRENTEEKLNSEKYSHIIIASDGTYGYVQRINEHTIAQKAWSGQKHRVLYKPHITIAVNGKAILCQTFYSNGHNNDQSISNAQTSAAYVRWCRNNLNDPLCIFSKEQVDELLYFQQHVYLPGDVHLADGGYYYALDERLTSPPRVQKSAGDQQFSIDQTNEKARVTLYRGVIERYFSHVKRYKMLGTQLSWHHLRYYDQLWKIGCALTNNFAPNLTADCPRNDNIVARIEDCEEFQINILEESVEEYNQEIAAAAKGTKGWTTEAVGLDNVINFLRELPWLKQLKLTVKDWEYFCGQRYLCKISYGYLRALDDKLELRVANNEPHVLRFSKIRSKFRSGKEHTVFLNFVHCSGVPAARPWSNKDRGRDVSLWGDSCLNQLQHYCSTCAGGRRLIIPDIHCAVALLLCIAIATNKLQELRTAKRLQNSLPANLIDAEPSKVWLEQRGISKKQVLTHQRLLNKEQKSKGAAGRKKKTRGTTSKRKKKPQPKNKKKKKKPKANNSNAATDSNRNIRFYELSEDEKKDNSGDESTDNNHAEDMNSHYRVDIDYEQLGVHTVDCALCGEVVPLFDEIDEDWDATDEPYRLCQSCVLNI